jgi:hypothetical protein
LSPSQRRRPSEKRESPRWHTVALAAGRATLCHQHFNLPILMKLRGDDESPRLTLGRVDSSVRRLVGTWRYDVWQTVVFPPCQSQPTLPDLLALAECTNERDWTRDRYPETLFLAIKALFNGAVSTSTNPCSRKAALATLDVADAAKIVLLRLSPVSDSVWSRRLF